MSANESKQYDNLDDLVAAQMREHQVPGVTVGILRDGEIETHGYGVISLATNYPTRPDTLFQIGSNTKIFTTTLVMRLVEQDKLDLDTPVKQYLPDLKLADEQALNVITLRHLLTHTSGLEGDRFENTGNGDDALAQFVAQAYTWAQETDPGEFWSYCNSGFDLTGRVIEAVTGKVYEDAIKEYVFEPLGLNMSFFFAHECIMYSVAAGHQQYPGQDEPTVAHPWPIPRASNPAGAIISCVEDVLKFCRFHMGDGTVDGQQILTPESLALMKTPQTTITEGSHWGVGWSLSDAEGARVVRHGGGTNGHITGMTTIPSRQFAISVLTNSTKGGEVIQAVEKWAFEKYCGVREPKPQPIELPREQLERLTGVYSQTAGTTTIAVEDDHLTATTVMKHPLSGDEISLPPEKLTPIGEWEVMTDEGSRAQFIAGDGGKPRFLRMGRLARRVA